MSARTASGTTSRTADPHHSVDFERDDFGWLAVCQCTPTTFDVSTGRTRDEAEHEWHKHVVQAHRSDQSDRVSPADDRRPS